MVSTKLRVVFIPNYEVTSAFSSVLTYTKVTYHAHILYSDHIEEERKEGRKGVGKQHFAFITSAIGAF